MGSWIDSQFTNWYLHGQEWGVEFDWNVLATTVRSYTIVVYPDWTVPGDGMGTYWGFTWYWPSNTIEVNLDPSFTPEVTQWDPGYWGLGDVGVVVLPHEFTHTVRGNWHP